MLEGLASVRWHELSHAFGEADDVPGLIKAVASPDKATRDRAWHALYGNLWHQGTIYGATPHAVPFFIELAETPSLPDRQRVLGYLVSLATGSSYRDVHQHLQLFAEDRTKAEFQRERGKELGWVHATREAVGCGRRLYGRLLGDESTPVRTTAAHLLSLFPEHADEHVLWLQEQVARGERDEKARTWCVVAVGRLGASEPRAAAAWLQQAFETDASEGVRVAAALGLAWSKGRDLPDGAYDLIRRNARKPGPAAELFEHLPWDEGNEVMQLYCSDAIGRLRDPTDQSLTSLVEAMNDVAEYQAIEIVRSLLDRVFDGKPMPPTTTAVQLTSDQRTVLEAISTSEKIWFDLTGKVLASAAIGIMQEFGLPTNVVRLKAFLQGRITPQDGTWSQALLDLKPSPLLAELKRKMAERLEQVRTLRSKPEADDDSH